MHSESELIDETHLRMIMDLTNEDGICLSKELLEHFTTTGSQALDELLSSIESGSREATQRSAHRLKGMSSNLGLKRLHLACKSIEEWARDGREPVLSAEEATELRGLYEESLGAYTRFIGSSE